MAREIDLLTAARADALIASDLSAWREHTQAVVTAAIRHAIRAHGGSRGCAGEVAAAYGEYGELAARRMRWALAVVEACYPPSSGGPSAVRAAVATARPAAHEAPQLPTRGEVPRPTDRPHVIVPRPHPTSVLCRSSRRNEQQC